MMRFTVGLSILIFTIIVGAYQFFQNKQTVTQRERGFVSVQQKLRQNQQLVESMKLVRERAMERGSDQKFTIERLIGIGEPGLSFEFVGRPTTSGSVDDRTFYRHTYRITGVSDFNSALVALKKLTQTSGFTVNKFCMNCTRTPRNAPTGFKTVQIEGYLYVYDPKSI